MTRKLHKQNGKPSLCQSRNERPGTQKKVEPDGSQHAEADLLVQNIILGLQQDLKDITSFYNISISSRRRHRINQCLKDTLGNLEHIRFPKLSQEGKVDYLLTQSNIKQSFKELDIERHKLSKIQPLLGKWFARVEQFCYRRQTVSEQNWQANSSHIDNAATEVELLISKLEQDKFEWKGDRSLAARAVKVVNELNESFEEAFKFYDTYDPLATWWLTEPCKRLTCQLKLFSAAITKYLVGLGAGEKDAIIGDPIGRTGILADLESEFISYSPEELIGIAESEYKWCESEMIRASKELGYGSSWRDALEHVKKMFVEPGKQTLLVQRLAKEAVDYVKKHDLVTVPWVCEETQKTFMMTPERQKVNPFFLGGSNIIVSYPTVGMSHQDKMMSMRGNSIPFSKATVFHELIPGHHLQYHMIKRYKTYRRGMFNTPFWMEGWALYWEFLFWERGDFFVTPEERIGTLFWRMHRCARIIFSIKFHLGQMTPQECVDYLVDKVGHELATAEGEVRRSFNGSYRPLYQAGYMLGALQLRQLRHELVDCGKWEEKDFHDQILSKNEMPIDMLRALLRDTVLSPHYTPEWRFYHEDWHSWGGDRAARSVNLSIDRHQ